MLGDIAMCDIPQTWDVAVCTVSDAFRMHLPAFLYRVWCTLHYSIHLRCTHFSFCEWFCMAGVLLHHERRVKHNFQFWLEKMERTFGISVHFLTSESLWGYGFLLWHFIYLGLLVEVYLQRFLAFSARWKWLVIMSNLIYFWWTSPSICY